MLAFKGRQVGSNMAPLRANFRDQNVLVPLLAGSTASFLFWHDTPAIGVILNWIDITANIVDPGAVSYQLQVADLQNPGKHFAQFSVIDASGNVYTTASVPLVITKNGP